MKPMNDRKMGMNKGKPDSKGFFPEGAHVKKIKCAGEIKRDDYPDSSEQILSRQNAQIKDISSSKKKHRD